MFRQLREAVRAQAAQTGAATRAGCAHNSDSVWAMNVPDYRSSGAALCCGLIHQHRYGHPLPIVVTYALVVAEPCAWAGARRVARCTARLRFELRDQSAPSCAQCCARMCIRCTRLSIPDATRMYARCANFQTTAVSWLQRESWHCGCARVMDVLLLLLHCWRWSGEPSSQTAPALRKTMLRARQCGLSFLHHLIFPDHQRCQLGIGSAHVWGLWLFGSPSSPSRWLRRLLSQTSFARLPTTAPARG